MAADLEVLRGYAADHHGVVTGAAAAALGVPAAALFDLASRDVLAHVAGDVYRWVELITPLTEYAEAVALAGTGAVLADDAVLALHDLALVNPRRLRVVVPGPPADPAPVPWVQVLFRDLPEADITEVEGIPAMTVTAALRACRGRVMTERLLHAVDRAFADGLIDAATAEALRAEFAPASLPPAPWTWRRISPAELARRERLDTRDPEAYAMVKTDTKATAWALVAADGTPVLVCESGFASPEIAGGLPGPVAELLARAPELAERVRQLEDRPPAVSPAALTPAGIEAFVDVVAVQLIERFELDLTWSDGAVRLVDVEPYLWGQVGEPLRDPRLFASVRVDAEAGTITWPVTGFDISPVELRRVARPAHQAVAPGGRTATREEVLAARDHLRRLAADHDLAEPRVDATGVVVVTMPLDEAG